MNKKVILNCIIACLLLCQVAASEQKDDLQIYLPREVTVSNGTLLLGNVGIARGPEALVSKANQVTLGRFSMPGQKIIVPRHTILSRLASNGISSSDVVLKGAEEVTVKQKQEIITSDDFKSLAEDYLKKNLIDQSITGWKPIRTAQELVVPKSSEDIKCTYALGKNTQGNQVNVKITIQSGEKIIGSRNATFRLEYENRTPVALVDIEQGTVINSENVKIEKRPSNYPESVDWKAPYGLIAKRKIPANAVISDNMIGTVESQIIIKRNQNVVIRIERSAFIITAVGKTMQEGRVGDYIRVKNVDSQNIIIAKVNEDGSVEPLL